jgi:hypothetical protein
MVVHSQNAGAWSLCWVLVVIIASINTSSAAYSGDCLSVRQHIAFSVHAFDLVAPNLGGTGAGIYVKRYLGEARQETELILGRAELYFPDIEAILEEQGLPNALKYIPMVESTLLPGVVSPAGAAGLWQIMPATARYLGLQVDGAADERFDPLLSGRAAITMLQELYAEFGDWVLALAAYNCGPGRMRRAISKAGSRDYEQLSVFLPKQTRCYISKYFAFAHIAHYWQHYKLEPKKDPDFLKAGNAAPKESIVVKIQEPQEQKDRGPDKFRETAPDFRGDSQGSAAGGGTVSPGRGIKWIAPAVGQSEVSVEGGDVVSEPRVWPLSGKPLAPARRSWGFRGLLRKYLLLREEIGQFSLAAFQHTLQHEGAMAILDNFIEKYFMSRPIDNA